MAGLDFIWLKFVVSSFFFQQIGHLARTQKGTFDVLYIPAIFTYILMVLVLIVFVYPLSKGDPLKGLCYGAILGGILFGVYEGTNMATLRDWPLKMVLVDSAWGIFLCAITAGITLFLLPKIDSFAF
jgi:uncharacterized membrane protein